MNAPTMPGWPERTAFETPGDPGPHDSDNCRCVRCAAFYKASAEAALAHLRVLHKAVTDFNDACEQSCGVGDQEGVECKYRPYFPRHCPTCPRDNIICDDYGTRLDHVVGEVPKP